MGDQGATPKLKNKLLVTPQCFKHDHHVWIHTVASMAMFMAARRSQGSPRVVMALAKSSNLVVVSTPRKNTSQSTNPAQILRKIKHVKNQKQAMHQVAKQKRRHLAEAAIPSRLLRVAPSPGDVILVILLTFPTCWHGEIMLLSALATGGNMESGDHSIGKLHHVVDNCSQHLGLTVTRGAGAHWLLVGSLFVSHLTCHVCGTTWFIGSGWSTDPQLYKALSHAYWDSPCRPNQGTSFSSYAVNWWPSNNRKWGLIHWCK